MAQDAPFGNLIQRADALDTASAEPGIIGEPSNEQLWSAQLRQLGGQWGVRGWLIPLPTANYPSNEASFRPSSVATIDATAHFLRQFSGTRAIVEGHSDSQGSGVTNERLSRARAEAVCRYLERQGVDAHRLQAIGVADREPIANNATSSGRARNRRVDLVLSDDNGQFGAAAESKFKPRVIRPIYGHHPLHRRLPLGVEKH